MQRVWVMVAVFLLVLAALAAGSLAAHWPFWQRAWQWQVAAPDWPQTLPGPTAQLTGNPQLPPLRFAEDAALAAVARAARTQVLVVVDRTGPARAFFAAGFSGDSQIDGRGLVAGLMGPLFGTLQVTREGLLDTPLREHLAVWRDSPRGAITPRQLLWQLSGLAAEPFTPLNPASRRAQLSSGPDFHRAVSHWRLIYPPGSHFAESPVNAQALGLLATRLEKRELPAILQQRLWSRFARQEATATLDHRRGHMAAHCCLRAAVEDWLRLGLLLADAGRVAETAVLPAGFVTELAGVSAVHPGYGLGFTVTPLPDGQPLLGLTTPGRTLLAAPGQGRALLWVGPGAPPPDLAQLLQAAMVADPAG